MIRPCAAGDAAAICTIYNEFVCDTVVTFEEEPVTSDEMERRIRNVTASLPWIVDERDGVVTGYAYAAPWMTRSAYRRSVESTVYVAPDCAGQGIGTALYTALIEDLRGRDVHCMIGGIALPNPASIRLHEKLGFRKVAQFAEVGWKFGRWIDVGYWQLLL